MGFGGSVQAMIESLRRNARPRPSLSINFNKQEYFQRRRLKQISKWKKLSPQ